MYLEITGIVLGLIAIGLIIYFNKQQKINNDLIEGDVQHIQDALLVLQKEFTRYQVDQEKHSRDDITSREIRFDRVAKSIQKNEDKIYALRKELPSIIGTVVGQIEFAQDKINRKM